MKKNKDLKPIFKKMEEMGWDLDMGFDEVFKMHTDYIDEIVEKARNEEIEEDELVWCCQFIGDFLCCMEEYLHEQNNKGEKK